VSLIVGLDRAAKKGDLSLVLDENETKRDLRELDGLERTEVMYSTLNGPTSANSELRKEI
jgi:hypothetical protein